MRYQIVVTEGWQASLHDEHGGAVDGAQTRQLQRQETSSAGVFPLPPIGEVPPPNPGDAADIAEYRRLCQPGESSPLPDRLKEIAERSLGNTVPFARYLFSTLLGGAWWNILKPKTTNGYLKLEMVWRAEQKALHRLPWEMMHDGTDFLARCTRLAIIRRILNAPATVASTSLPLRVLFVSGTHAGDPAIRPGAEFLSVLRHQHQRLALKTHLVLQSTPDDLKEAVAWFQPTVIHFICHGDVDPQSGGYLLLVKPNNPNETIKVFGPDLLENITRIAANGSPVLPQVVVLNACFSAALPDQDVDMGERVTGPLAVELVQKIPVVVGMGGRVADQACRLFTACFYDALMKDGQIVRATAEGRRFGIWHGTDPKTSVDWAMPTLFLAGGTTTLPNWNVQPQVELDWQARATDMVPADRFPVFCDRLKFWSWYSLLMTPALVQRKVAELQGMELQLLAIAAEPAPKIGQGRQQRQTQFGRTWLLEEFAAQAIRDGHFACLIKSDANDAPQDLETLLARIRDEATGRRNLFRGHAELKQWSWMWINQLRRLHKGDEAPANFPEELRQAYVDDFDKDPRDPRVMCTALRCDLRALVRACRASRPDSDHVKLLLLFDDVHKYVDKGLESLFTLLGPHGLRPAIDDIRVILVYQANATDIKNKLLTSGIRSEILSAFSTPEDFLAYEHFMLHWRRQNRPYPVTVIRSADRRAFLQTFGGSVKGIPSELEVIGMTLLEWNIAINPPVLRQANDEDLGDFITRERKIP